MVVAIRKDVLNIDNMSIQKNLKKSIKKIPKDKNEITSDLVKLQKVAHLKDVVRGIFPIIKNTDSIYDAQTTVMALSGFILAHLENKLKDIKLSECEIKQFLDKEEDGKIKTALNELLEKFADEPAKELSESLQKLGDTFTNFGADKFLKNSMDTIDVGDIIAEDKK